jgi:hypothetical protein
MSRDMIRSGVLHTCNVGLGASSEYTARDLVDYSRITTDAGDIVDSATA